jgi:hypothetical protein
MERRIYKRVPVGIGADIISDNIDYGAYIGNLSAYGLYLIAVQTEDTVNFKVKNKFQLQCQIHTGETLHLYCRKRWLYTISPHSFVNRIGVEIVAPPLRYKELLYNLHKSTLPRVKGVVTVNQGLSFPGDFQKKSGLHIIFK